MTDLITALQGDKEEERGNVQPSMPLRKGGLEHKAQMLWYGCSGYDTLLLALGARGKLYKVQRGTV